MELRVPAPIMTSLLEKVQMPSELTPCQQYHFSILLLCITNYCYCLDSLDFAKTASYLAILC
jgi:hypothetical protein